MSNRSKTGTNILANSSAGRPSHFKKAFLARSVPDPRTKNMFITIDYCLNALPYLQKWNHVSLNSPELLNVHDVRKDNVNIKCTFESWGDIIPTRINNETPETTKNMIDSILNAMTFLHKNKISLHPDFSNIRRNKLGSAKFFPRPTGIDNYEFDPQRDILELVSFLQNFLKLANPEILAKLNSFLEKCKTVQKGIPYIRREIEKAFLTKPQPILVKSINAPTGGFKQVDTKTMIISLIKKMLEFQIDRKVSKKNSILNIDGTIDCPLTGPIPPEDQDKVSKDYAYALGNIAFWLLTEHSLQVSIIDSVSNENVKPWKSMIKRCVEGKDTRISIEEALSLASGTPDTVPFYVNFGTSKSIKLEKLFSCRVENVKKEVNQSVCIDLKELLLQIFKESRPMRIDLRQIMIGINPKIKFSIFPVESFDPKQLVNLIYYFFSDGNMKLYPEDQTKDFLGMPFKYYNFIQELMNSEVSFQDIPGLIQSLPEARFFFMLEENKYYNLQLAFTYRDYGDEIKKITKKCTLKQLQDGTFYVSHNASPPTCNIDNPHVAKIYGYSKKQKSVFLEYVDGEALTTLIKRAKIDELLDYAIQIGETLEQIHKMNQYLDALCPSRILITKSKAVKLLTVGAASKFVSGPFNDVLLLGIVLLYMVANEKMGIPGSKTLIISEKLGLSDLQQFILRYTFSLQPEERLTAYEFTELLKYIKKPKIDTPTDEKYKKSHNSRQVVNKYFIVPISTILLNMIDNPVFTDDPTTILIDQMGNVEYTKEAEMVNQYETVRILSKIALILIAKAPLPEDLRPFINTILKASPFWKEFFACILCDKMPMSLRIFEEAISNRFTAKVSPDGRVDKMKCLCLNFNGSKQITLADVPQLSIEQVNSSSLFYVDQLILNLIKQVVQEPNPFISPETLLIDDKFNLIFDKSVQPSPLYQKNSENPLADSIYSIGMIAAFLVLQGDNEKVEKVSSGDYDVINDLFWINFIEQCVNFKGIHEIYNLNEMLMQAKSKIGLVINFRIDQKISLSNLFSQCIDHDQLLIEFEEEEEYEEEEYEEEASDYNDQFSEAETKSAFDFW